MSETYQLSGQRLHEDDSYVVLKSPGFLGISHPFFATIHVFVKSRSMAVKATQQEKTFLLGVLGELTRQGITGPRTETKQLMNSFAVAVAARGGVAWKVFFETHTPAQVAARYRVGI